MLLSLLLQLSTTTTATKTITITEGILPVVYGTLIVGVLSFIASITAIIVNRNTATQVAKLARSTSQEVAALSAQVSRESAGLAAQTARELKDTDYKNDFYKKLIEKRLVAWTEAEGFMKSLADITRDVKDGQNFFTYFNKPESFIKVVDHINGSILTQVIWIGGDYNKAALAFRQKLIDIWGECYRKDCHDENRHTRIDEKLLWAAGKRYYIELTDLYTQMAIALTSQLSSLHRIEGFLTSLQPPQQAAPVAPAVTA